MTKLVVYIAASLDGYIARENGEVDWLSAYDSAGEDYGYNAFYESVDALIMGRRSYEQIKGFGEWPYAGKTCYVFSNSLHDGIDNNIKIINQQPEEYIHSDNYQSHQKIWLLGGAKLAAAFLDHQLIDELIISITPNLLSRGIPLFIDAPESHLTLLNSTSYETGIVQVHYAMNNQQKAQPIQ